MKRILPILIIVVIALGAIAGGAYYFYKKSTAAPVTQDENLDDEANVPELPMNQRPYASLTPSADGHNLHLSVAKIPSNAAIVEYDLRYTNDQGVNQGVTSEGRLSGSVTLERDLLMGSCSSGKCKYDEGVEYGTLSIKLRDTKRKLIAKTMTTPFHLMKAPTQITLSDDSAFSLKLDKPDKADFFVAMQTIGIPDNLPGTFQAGPYGVFTSAKDPNLSGVVALDGEGGTYLFDGNTWTKITNGKTTKLGIFATSS